jgi:hypothetical protein
MRKYLLSIAIFLVLLVSSAIFIPYLFKDEIVEKIKSEINSQISAQLSFNNDITINILKSFPDLSIALSDVAIHHSDSTFSKDTLVQIKKVSTVLDLRELYQNQNIVLKAFSLDKPTIHMEYVNDSLNNWDIFKTEDTTGSSISINLNTITVTNGEFTYIDQPSKMRVGLRDINHTSTGNYKNGNLILDSESEAEEFYVQYGGVAYINQWHLTQKGLLELFIEKEEYRFVKNKLSINGLPIDLNGSIAYKKEDLLFNLEALSASSDITDFLTLIPVVYKSDFNKIVASGKGTLEANYKGTYSDSTYPGFNINLSIVNGSFKYPDLPKKIENIDLNFIVDSKDGTMNHTVVNLNPCKFKIDNNPFQLQFNAKNLEYNPLLDAEVKGVLNLGSIKQALPLETKFLDGVINADFALLGSSSAIEQQSIEDLRMSGNVAISQLALQTEVMDKKLEVKKALLSFNNATLNIPVLEAKWGNNDLNTSGYLDNIIGYLRQGSTLSGKLTASSKYLNLNDFLDKTSSPEDTLVLETIRIPENIAISTNISADKLFYDDYAFTNFKGIAQIENETLVLNNINTDLWGGTAFLEGTYNSASEQPEADFTLSYSNVSVKNLLKYSNVLKTLVPVAENVTGNTFAKLSIHSIFNEGMKPDLAALDLSGLLNVVDVAVQESKLLNVISQQLDIPKLDGKKLNNLVFDFDLKEGKLLVKPFNIYFNDALIRLEGYTRITGEMDYQGFLSIPGSLINNNVKTVTKVTQNTPFEGQIIKDEDYLDLDLQVKGLLLKPEVTIRLDKLKKNLKESLTELAEDEVEKQKKQAEEAANKELEKLKKEAERKKQEAEERIKQEIEKGKKEAEDRLKQELDQKKEETEEKVKRKLKDLLKRKK